MAAKGKYTPDISLEDVSTYVQEHRRSTGLEARIVLHFGTGPGGGDWSEVRLCRPDSLISEGPTVLTRSELPSRRPSRVFAVLLHTVAQAYQELELNPWLWTPEKRAEARGE